MNRLRTAVIGGWFRTIALAGPVIVLASGFAVAQTSNTDTRIAELEERVHALESDLQRLGPSEAEARDVISAFHEGLANRDLSAIEKLVSPEIVVLENGNRNDGWVDFRDNHLKPEFKEPAAPSSLELVKLVATPKMAWGYTRQIVTVKRPNGESADLVVWSLYILEARQGQWKITFLDWSVKVSRPPKS